ncbi:hypothetical protein PC116_g31462 [Phytophthora cactorum]|nr:hypothetical protein PC116_g31462 [Phytophthora cactorum]
MLSAAAEDELRGGRGPLDQVVVAGVGVDRLADDVVRVRDI